MSTILFVNGSPPRFLPDLKSSTIYCTDGAYRYLEAKGINPDYVVGDMDSIGMEEVGGETKVLHTPDQDYTDFEKALELIVEKGVKELDVYGAGGEEHDHFLGNLSSALRFKERIRITFKDDLQTFFFCPKNIALHVAPGQLVSLMPFPIAIGITTKGLEYPLRNEDLEIGKRMGIRNRAQDKDVEISYVSGEMLIFLERK